MKHPNKAISDAAYRDGLFKNTHPNNPQGWNILCIIHDRVTACEEYRVIQPMQELEAQGHNIYIMNASTYMNRLGRKVDDFLGCDLLVLNRIVTKEGTADVYKLVVEEAWTRGVSSIVDFDDDFRNVHRDVHDGILPDLSGFSAITVTTDILKAAYGGMNKHIYVLPNLIQLKRFENQPREIDGLVIGLSGSSTHAKDWEPAARALRRVLDERPEVKAFVSGYMPPELDKHPQVLTPGMLHPEYTANSPLLVSYTHYPWVLCQCDILLCPVDPEDKFNWHKSPLKLLEGWAAGCAVIATGGKLPIYQSVGNNLDDVLLVDHTELSYYTYLSFLVENSGLRHTLKEMGAHQVKKWSSLEDTRPLIYHTIIERDRRARLRMKEKQNAAK